MTDFDLEAFKNGAVAVDNFGCEHECIAYIPEARNYYQLVSLSDGIVWTWNSSGRTNGELFLRMKPILRMKPRTVTVHYALVRESDGRLQACGPYSSAQVLEDIVETIGATIVQRHSAEVPD
jgi:hypothetical protein